MPHPPPAHAAALLALLALAACARRAPQQPRAFVPCVTIGSSEIDSMAPWAQRARAWGAEAGQRWSNDSLRQVLLAMRDEDQRAREGLTAERMRDTAFTARMARVDSTNARRMREVIDRFGWPTRRMVGARGASAAWLVVQHSKELEQEALRLMLAAPPGEVSPSDLALLLDRTLMHEGKPQRYGTQLVPSGPGRMRLHPIEDPAGVDRRREAAGLMPLATYLAIIEEYYQARIDQTGCGG